ncbi:MAG: MscL family protein [Coprococcus sp.]
MKKFLEEFKEFALKGNVMSLAIGVIIGGAFQSLVTSFTDCFITPIINSIGGAEIVDIFRYSTWTVYRVWSVYFSSYQLHNHGICYICHHEGDQCDHGSW